jgi:hypothetical protein
MQHHRRSFVVILTGIVLNTAHFYPNDPNSQADITAAQRGYGEHLHLSKLLLSFVTRKRLWCFNLQTSGTAGSWTP